MHSSRADVGLAARLTELMDELSGSRGEIQQLSNENPTDDTAL